jgi:hypothetical protein
LDLGIPPNKLIPTGPTGFDFLHHEDTQKLGETFRKDNSISLDDTLIAYNAIRGTGLWSEIEVDATPQILSVVFRLAKRRPDIKFVFIYRFHPDDQNPGVLNGIIDERSTQPKNLRLIVHQPRETNDNGRSPLAAADLAITTVSTTNTGVALCGAKPEAERPGTGRMPLYFLSPIAAAELKKTSTILPTAAQLNAAAVAREDAELLPTVEQALFNDEFRQQIFDRQSHDLRDVYRFKGTTSATDRAILHLCRLLKNQTSV